MLNQIKANFTKCVANMCDEISNSAIIKIVETHDAKCIIDNASTKENFLVINDNRKDINFVAIDKCVFDDNAHKKCDFVLFDNAEFSFIEIKDTDTDNASNRTKYLKKAYDQLEEVIVRFKAVLNFNGYALEAIIAFRDRPTVPLALASNTAKRTLFLLTYNVDLKIGNEKKYV